MNLKKTIYLGILLLFFNTSIYAQKKKNVLVIMADDFNFWLKKNGYYPLVKTPNLDALATDGVLFSNAHCSSPVSNPSRNALWSGYRPSTTGISSNSGGYVRDKAAFKNIVSMHQYFKQEGYYTYGGGKLWHPGKMGAHDTDPTNWTELYTGGTGSPGGSYKKWTVPSKSNYSWSGGTFNVHDKAGDTKMADHFAKKIKNYDSDKPFFMALGFFRPHMPWNCSKEFWDMFDNSKIVKPQGYKAGDMNDVSDGTQNIHADIVKAGKWEDAIHGYLACLAYADYNAGIVLEALKSSKHKNNTIVVFMGDHGWHLGEKERWGKYALYDMAHWTSLIIYDPSAEGNGKVCAKPVSLQDLYPTLIELTGVDPKVNMEGRSIAPLVNDPKMEWNHPILMTYNGTNVIKTNEYRLVDKGNKSQLYNVATDPYEWNNLYGKSGTNATVNKLRNQIDSMVKLGTYLKNNGLKPAQGDPVVYLSAPYNKTKYADGAQVVLTAKAADPSGSISEVEFYDGAKLLGTDKTAPYSYNWSNAPSGNHTITVVATDNAGNKVKSVPVNITVGNSIAKDCAGVEGGTASIDECGICSGGTTGNVPATLPVITDIAVQNPSCSQEGSITFTFPDTDNRTKIEFSLNGGVTYAEAVADNSGTFAFTNLSAGVYNLSVRWGNDVCPLDLGAVELQASDCLKDCAGVEGGSAKEDCGTCWDGNTGLAKPDADKDGIVDCMDECPDDATNTCNDNGEIKDIADLATTETACKTIVLSWSDVAQEDAYRVRRKVYGASTFTSLGDVPADATEYTDKAVTEGVIYIYQVRPMLNGKAVKVSNNPEITVSACQTGEISDITDLKAIATDCNTVELSWSDVAKEDAYRVRRKKEGDLRYTNIGDVKADVVSFIDNTVAENTTYIYQVRPMQNGKAVKVSNNPQVKTPVCGSTKSAQLATDVEGTGAVEVIMFPNPADELLTVIAPELIKSVMVYLKDGKQVPVKIQINGAVAKISLDSVEAGVYVVSVKTENGLFTKAIVKK